MGTTTYRCGNCNDRFSLYNHHHEIGSMVVAIVECPHCSDNVGIMTYQSNIAFDGMVHTDDPTSNWTAYKKWVSDSTSDNPLLIPILY
jgi:DNA-directed RNA polymerase subunit RPC12/RpoP